jgi:hypothetical protein
MLLAAGCDSPHVKPPQARVNTGYVAFYADSTAGLSWDVAQFDEPSQSYQRVFSELEPPQGGVLRLAFTPGHHRLRVTVLNRVIAEPALLDVEVTDGRITPVHVALTESGVTSVQTKETSRGGTASAAMLGAPKSAAMKPGCIA